MKRIQILIAAICLICMSGCAGCRQYERNQAEMDAESKGKQTLLEAESGKKAQIEEARAKNTAASMEADTKIQIAKAEAQAEVERAKGVAEANRIIGESLKDNESYLRYLWITGLHDGSGERIYIPTEAGLPIFEAK